jgi:hypothetical protein
VQIADEIVLNDDGIFAMNQKDCLFELKIGAAIGESGKWIEPEGVKVFESARMDHVPILIGTQFEAPVTNDEYFFDIRKQHGTPDRWPGGRGEQRMITARVHPDDGGTGEPANAIGFEPFARTCVAWIAVYRAIELDR